MRLVEQKREDYYHRDVIVEEAKPARMSKYFTRNASEDFSDDGNRFYSYRYNDVLEVTKHHSYNGYFISARVDDAEGRLNYKEYSALPHYDELDKYNHGESEFTDEDAQDLVNICKAFSEEYLKAASEASEPDNEEYLNYHRGVNNVAKEYYQKALEEIKQIDIAKMSRYDLKYVQQYLAELKRAAKDLDEKELSGHNNAYKREVLSSKEEYNPFWYNELLERIKRICDKTEDNDWYKD